MTADEKRYFIADLMERTTRSLLAEVPKMPEHWDGHELRQYITDHMAERAVMSKMDKQRMAAYRNDVLIHNL